MPSTIKIRVYGARDLPVMDSKTNLADPFVTIKFGTCKKQETRIVRKTLNPVWQESFRIDVTDDNMLQDEPIIFRVMDKDSYTADDSIGVVIIDLNCLLSNTAATVPQPSDDGDRAGGGGGGDDTAGGGVLHIGAGAGAATNKISGWFPIYDTLHGIRGQLRLSVKLQFFGDVNPFKDSAAGIPLFSASSLEGHCIHEILGFVEELIVENDPEYHWMDSFRASETSNESRQKLFYQLTSKVRRNVGRKCIEKGGNAVLAYRQIFDLEGTSGITTRAYGTACRIHKLGANGSCDSPARNPIDYLSSQIVISSHSPAFGLSSTGPMANLLLNPNLASEIDKAASNGSGGGGLPSDDKANGLMMNDSSSNPGVLGTASPLKSEAVMKLAESRRVGGTVGGVGVGVGVGSWKREVHLLSMTEFPSTVQVTLGGIVSTSAIKLLDPSFDSKTQETRDEWWREIRAELKGHARALRCPLIIGYREVTTIFEGIAVLSAYGTAARVGWHRSSHHHSHHITGAAGSHVSHVMHSPAGNSLLQMPRSAKASPRMMPMPMPAPRIESDEPRLQSALRRHRKQLSACSVFHVPYTRKTAPFRMTLVPCQMCGRKYVPEILLATIQPHPQGSQQTGGGRLAAIGSLGGGSACYGMALGSEADDGFGYGFPILGTGQLVEARVCRAKKRAAGEANATLVSEAIPFLEYDLHRQLMYKLRVMGMNAAFALRWQLTIGENMIIGVATATAMYCPALPPPPVLQISRSIAVEDEEDKQLVAIQNRLMELSAANQKYWAGVLSQWNQSRAWWKLQREKELEDERNAEHEQERQLAKMLQHRGSSGSTGTAAAAAATAVPPITITAATPPRNSSQTPIPTAAAVAATVLSAATTSTGTLLLPPSVSTANPSLSASLSLLSTTSTTMGTLNNTSTLEQPQREPPSVFSVFPDLPHAKPSQQHSTPQLTTVTTPTSAAAAAGSNSAPHTAAAISATAKFSPLLIPPSLPPNAFALPPLQHQLPALQPPSSQSQSHLNRTSGSVPSSAAVDEAEFRRSSGSKPQLQLNDAPVLSFIASNNTNTLPPSTVASPPARSTVPPLKLNPPPSPLQTVPSLSVSYFPSGAGLAVPILPRTQSDSAAAPQSQIAVIVPTDPEHYQTVGSGSARASPIKRAKLKELDIPTAGKLSLPPRAAGRIRNKLARTDRDGAESSGSDTSDSDNEDIAGNDNHGGDHNKQSFVLSVDDEVDEDTMAVLLEPSPPPNIVFANTETVPRDDWAPFYDLFITQLNHLQSSQQQPASTPLNIPSTVATASTTAGPAVVAGSNEPSSNVAAGVANTSSNPQNSLTIDSAKLLVPPSNASTPTHVPIAPASFFMSPHLPYLSSGLQNVQMFTLIRRVVWNDDASGVTARPAKVIPVTQKKSTDKKSAVGGSGKDLIGKTGRPKVVLPPNPNQIRLRPKPLNQRLAAVFHDLYAALSFKVRSFVPCYICGLRTDVRLPDEDTLEIVLTAMAVRPVVHLSPAAAAAAALGIGPAGGEDEDDEDGGDSSDGSDVEDRKRSSVKVHSSSIKGVPLSGVIPPPNKRMTSKERRSGGATANDRMQLLRERDSEANLKRSGTPSVAAPMSPTSAAIAAAAAATAASAITSSPASTVGSIALPGLQPLPNAGPLSAPLSSIHLSVKGKSTPSNITMVANDPKASIKFENPTPSSSSTTQIAPTTIVNAATPSATPTSGLAALSEEKRKHLAASPGLSKDMKVAQSAPPVSRSINDLLPPSRPSAVLGPPPAMPPLHPPTPATAPSNIITAPTTPFKPMHQFGLSPNPRLTQRRRSGSIGPHTADNSSSSSDDDDDNAKPKTKGLKSRKESADPRRFAPSKSPLPALPLSSPMQVKPTTAAPSFLPTPLSAAAFETANNPPSNVTSPQSSMGTSIAGSGGSAPPLWPTFINHRTHHNFIESTPLAHLPNATIERYLGRVDIHFIQEIEDYQRDGGIGAFTHRFFSEANSALRAHVISRGGNAMVGYLINELQVVYANKNQAYAVISVSADAVRVDYYETGPIPHWTRGGGSGTAAPSLPHTPPRAMSLDFLSGGTNAKPPNSNTGMKDNLT